MLAILIIEIDFLKDRQRRSFKKSIFVFSAQQMIETQKSFSIMNENFSKM
jgi:hypothetical protein